MADRKRLPFHEWLVEAIATMTDMSAFCIADAIEEVIIPKDHDKIALAWKKRLMEIYPNMVAESDPFDVLVNLEEQKREAEEKARAKVADQATKDMVDLLK